MIFSSGETQRRLLQTKIYYQFFYSIRKSTLTNLPNQKLQKTPYSKIITAQAMWGNTTLFEEGVICAIKISAENMNDYVMRVLIRTVTYSSSNLRLQRENLKQRWGRLENGPFKKIQKKGRGWEYGICRGVKEIACGICRG